MRLAAAALALSLLPALAQAHPQHEVVQGAYLTLAPGEVRLELAVTPGSEVVGVLRRALDPDADGKITETEARDWATAVLAQSSLTLDGAPAAWRLLRFAAPPIEHLQSEAETLKVYAVADRPARPGSRSLTYDNRYRPAESQHTANVFLREAGGWRYQIVGQVRSPDGGQLKVDYVVSR